MAGRPPATPTAAMAPPPLPAKTAPGRTGGALPPTPGTPGAPSPASSTASSAADPADPSAVRQRRRHNLMSFYGIKEQAPGEGAGAAPGMDRPELTLSNPLDIDGNNFDPDQYLNKLMGEDSLRDLMRKTEAMDSEVRELDGNMKTLVYDNYNKFISATDTIRKMRENVTNMDQELKLLRQNIELITTGSSRVNTSLVEKRNRINQLSNVHSLLRKIQFVFELPGRLRRCLELEEYSEAYRYYSRTRDVLKMYQHVPSFTNIHNECEAIMKQVAQRLRVRLTAETCTCRLQTRSPQLSETVQILLGLREDPQLLWKEYLKGQQRLLTRALSRAGSLNQPPAPSAAKAGQRPSRDVAMDPDRFGVALGRSAEVLRNDPFLRLAHVHDAFIKDFADCVTKFLRLFVAVGGTTNMQQHQRALGVATDLTDEERRAAEDDLMRFVDDMAREYFEVVENVLEMNPNVPAKVYSLCLARLDRDIGELDNRLGLSDRVKLVSRARHLTNQFLLDFASKQFANVFRTISDHVHKVPERVRTILASNLAASASTPDRPTSPDRTSTPLSRGEEFHALVQDTTLTIIRTVDAAVTELDTFAQLDDPFIYPHLPAFTQCVFREAGHFWTTLGEALVHVGEQAHAEPEQANPALTLLLSKVCRELETTVIANVYSRLMEVFATGVRRSTVSQDLTDARTAFAKHGERLMTRFTELAGWRLTLLVRDHVERQPWASDAEPARVSDVWAQVAADIAAQEGLVEEVYGNEDAAESEAKASADARARPGQSGRGGAAARGGPSGGNPYGVNPYGAGAAAVDRLFREHVDIYADTIAYSKRAVTSALVRIALKALVEFVRELDLGRYGYKQMQVDAEYLRQRLWRFVAQESELTTLIDDALQSAEQRCFDVQPLSRTAIDSLVSAAV